jgi:hypothetical protein
MPSAVKTILTDALASLQTLTGIKTFAIGLEPSLNADHYPIARIVLESSKREHAGWVVVATVYVGDAISVHTGTDEQLEQATQLQQDALAALRTRATWRVESRETLYDADRVPGYKLAAIRVEITR